MTIASLRMLPALLLTGGLMVASTATATTIYDNSFNDIGVRFNPGTNRIGDEIFVAGTERFVTNFSFEYWGLNNGTTNGSFVGAPEVQIQFYLNDGTPFNTYPTPGTLFYSSSWFAITTPTDRSTLVFDETDFGGGFFLPFGAGISNFTWTVQFRNMGSTDTLGVDIYTPPIVGQEINDYWEFAAGSWSLKTNIVDMNFAAKLEASVPEPSSVALAILGGLGMLAVRRRFDSK